MDLSIPELFFVDASEVIMCLSLRQETDYSLLGYQIFYPWRYMVRIFNIQAIEKCDAKRIFLTRDWSAVVDRLPRTSQLVSALAIPCVKLSYVPQ